LRAAAFQLPGIERAGALGAEGEAFVLEELFRALGLPWRAR
jgi:hypothetical protein